MNIIHLTSSRFFGGPERQMLGLAQSLSSAFRTSFVSFWETGLCEAFLDEVRRAGFEGVALRHDTPHLLAARKELIEVLRRLDTNVLCCHGYKANLLGLLAARRIGIPVIAVSRGWTGECFRVRLYEALDRYLLRWMDKVVCVSAAQAEKVRHSGVRQQRITVIHNAIRPERFAHPDPAYRSLLCRMFPEPPTRIVGAAGRLSPEKGFDILIAAAAQVFNSPLSPSGRGAGGEGGNSPLSPPGRGAGGESGNSPLSPSGRGAGGESGNSPLSPHGRGAGGEGGNSPLSPPGRGAGGEGGNSPLSPSGRGAGGEGGRIGFILFGDGPLRDALTRQITAHGLENRFILAGFRPDLDRYLPHLDIFVQSSFTEGLPNVILEAQAAGVPVVATSVGGTPEVIENGQTGWLVPPGDATALAERIARLLADDLSREAFSRQGRADVEDRFSFIVQSRLYEDLFARLPSKSPAPRAAAFHAEQSAGIP